MNIDRKRLDFVFYFTLLATLLLPAITPNLRLNFFAPFLVIVFYQKTLPASLWVALCCGLVIDLLSSHSRIGIHALNFCLASWILYGQKRHFFADSLSTLPLMTFFFSVVSALLQVPLLYIFEKQVNTSVAWVLTDLIFMPALDAAYAFALFILPGMMMGKRPRRGSDYFQ